VKLEILEVREESDEIQDLSARANRLFEGKEPKIWREVPEALLYGWHKAGYLKKVYSKVLEVRKRGEVTQCMLVEPCRTKPWITDNPHAHTESFDEREQTKLV